MAPERLPTDQGLPAPGRYRDDSVGDVTGAVLLLRGRRAQVVLVVCLVLLGLLLVWLFV